MSFPLVESLAFLQYSGLEFAFVDSRTIRLLLQVVENIGALLHDGPIDDISISLSLNLNKNSLNDMFLYRRTDDVLDEE